MFISKFSAALLATLTLGLPSMAIAEMVTDDQSQPQEVVEATSKTIVEIAAGSDDFSTLVAAVKAAELVEALSGDGPFTVFAPTNEAFAKLPEGTVESLLKEENKDKLIAILKYHVVAGEVTSDKIQAGKVETLAGEMIKVKIKEGNVLINDATVTQADIDASNGVIHVIDSVILPPDA